MRKDRMGTHMAIVHMILPNAEELTPTTLYYE